MAHRIENSVYFVGFGSQARAWAQCLKASGWTVHVHLGRLEGASFEAAREQGWEPRLISELPRQLEAHRGASTEPARVAMLCPDTLIGPIYREFLARLPQPLTLVLAHGYAVYARDLEPARPEHELALLAPKAIGPKIASHFLEAAARDGNHRLVAGFRASPARETQVRALASAMRFAPGNLARATFEQEAVGDLLSEQGLLCGGVFTLLEWTIEAMQKAGTPPALIREECLTELELIAGLLRERGPSATFSAISQAAQCGTLVMRERLLASGVRAQFDDQLSEVLDRRFVERFRSDAWKAGARELIAKFKDLEAAMNPGAAGAAKESK